MPVPRPTDLPGRADDPRLGEVILQSGDDPPDLRPGQPVLVGFPCDEGVRRNGGRPGAAEAPARIRHWLYRLCPGDPSTGSDFSTLGLLDLGDVRVGEGLETAQQHLGEVVGHLLGAGCLPIVLGGGHETAHGTYLGYLAAGRTPAIVNLDAHLDVRPLLQGRGHSGSPFRQALEHPDRPLPGPQYICLGVQPFSTSVQHVRYLTERGARIGWVREVAGRLVERFQGECEHLAPTHCPVHVSLDADVVCSADVPGVSAPSPLGLSGREVADCVQAAGRCSQVRSLEVVEINPARDLDDRSARWAALVIGHFLAGLASR